MVEFHIKVSKQDQKMKRLILLKKGQSVLSKSDAEKNNEFRIEN